MTGQLKNLIQVNFICSYSLTGWNRLPPDRVTSHDIIVQAIELDPTELTFHNNLAAVYFEMKQYDQVCFTVCLVPVLISAQGTGHLN